MTVRELLERLAALPPDHNVWVDSGDHAASPGYLAVSAPGAGWDDYQVLIKDGDS